MPGMVLFIILAIPLAAGALSFAARKRPAMEAINAEISSHPAMHDVAFTLRVGVNSGAVLAGHSGGQYTVIGDAVNVAARLQEAAEPGSVTVGPATRRMTAAAIEYRELEPLALKGKAEAIPAGGGSSSSTPPR